MTRDPATQIWSCDRRGMWLQLRSQQRAPTPHLLLLRTPRKGLAWREGVRKKITPYSVRWEEKMETLQNYDWKTFPTYWELLNLNLV